MKRPQRQRMVLSLLNVAFLITAANVIVRLTDWSLLWVLLAVGATSTLLLLSFESRRRRRAQHAAESLPHAQQKV
jgi:Flp pilus assembly protein TadB